MIPSCSVFFKEPIINILVLTPTPSHPQDQGNRKGVYAFTREFSNRGATIHFLYVPSEWYGGFSPQYHREMSDAWDFFHVIPPAEKIGFPSGAGQMDVDCIWYPAIEDTLAWWSRDQHFDAVICHYVFLSKALTLFPRSTLKILYTHDRFSNRDQTLSEQGLTPDYFYTSPEQEGRAFDRADLVIAVKEAEAAAFETLSETPVMTIGHAGQPTPVSPRDPSVGPLRIGFIGSENAVNIANMNRFLSSYGPKLAEKNAFEAIFAGRVCQHLEPSGLPHTMLGRIDDVADFYAQVDLVFIPFDFSTGIKIKAIEAMAHHVPVIMTIDAADGMPVAIDQHRCSSQEAVFNALLQAADNRSTLKDLRAESRHVYDQIRQEIDDRIDDIMTLIKTQGSR